MSPFKLLNKFDTPFSTCKLQILVYVQVIAVHIHNVLKIMM